MKTMLGVPEINLMAAWVGVLLGVLGGMGMGMFFHREDWLGGYGSFQRRMYRLGHISFFGLAILNFMWFSTAFFVEFGFREQVAAWCFVFGAATMPMACLLTAHAPRLRPLFAVPVLNLIVASILAVAAVSPALGVKAQADRPSYEPRPLASKAISEAWE
jgi:hypothetical protein